MPLSWILLAVMAMSALAFVVARQRVLAQAGGDARRLHSRPVYYGWHAALLGLVPAAVILALWAMAQPVIVVTAMERHIPDTLTLEGGTDVGTEVRRAATAIKRAEREGVITRAEARGLDATDTEVIARMKDAGLILPPTPEVIAAATATRTTLDRAGLVVTALALLAALGGVALAVMRTSPAFRARNVVEQIVRGGLIACSLIAIATTIGIVLSLVFESWHFFRLYPWQDFLFGTEWTPSFGGNSKLGMLPLLWGTLYISFIALLVAVPIGLFAAIYMAEYAGARVRSWVKPAIEVLAGIPTIVYGLFALVTVGPLIRDWIARPAGFGDSGSSVMTAGLVMGVMLIPFVSSLSDDIINAVPQSLRDGSLGLGSTPSETIRHVVLPAALPGIVGAILLAASRAIGETMIVVLGAGAMAQMNLNPFEAMTTITVKIVGQLTGDNDFNSPETLVAFALGLTLFVITLGLNIFALYIVRKYREQYE